MKRDEIIDRVVAALQALPEDCSVEDAEYAVDELWDDLDPVPGADDYERFVYEIPEAAISRVIMGDVAYFFSPDCDDDFREEYADTYGDNIDLALERLEGCECEPCDTGIPGGTKFCKHCGRDM